MARVGMVAHSYFPHNARTRIQALSLARAGHDVEMVCPRAPGEPSAETVGGVLVTRVAVSRDRSRGFAGYLAEYGRFFALARAAVARRGAERHFDVVVVHNIPEQLVYAAAPAKRKGAAVVLDVHDPLPELFAEKFGLPEGSPVVAALKRFELAACRYADHVFVATDPLKDRLVALGYPAERITPILNSPQPAPAAGPEPFVVLYHGSVAERYDLDTVLRALRTAAADVPGIELHVYGSDVDDRCLEGLRRLAQDLGVGERVAFNGPAAPLALRRVLAGADLGVVPMRRPSHIDLAYPMKLFEYVANGVPALCVRTEALERLFGEAEDVAFFEAGDDGDLARGLVAAARAARPPRALPPRPNRLRDDLAWPEMERRYTAVVERLADR